MVLKLIKRLNGAHLRTRDSVEQKKKFARIVDQNENLKKALFRQLQKHLVCY